MEKKTAVAIKETDVVEVRMGPSALIELAISKGADLDKLEKLLTLQERYEATEARKAYNKAIAEFKANPPKIDKDRDVAYGNTKYSHASLGNVTEKIGAELAKYGLSASWSTKQNGAVSVTCKITHVRGHSEETTLSAASDTSGSKNAIQAIGSTITYLERYTLLALTGLATYDQDDDGVAAGAPVEYITDKERSELLDLCADCGADMPKFLKYLKVEGLDKLPKAELAKAKLALAAKKDKKVAK